MTLELGVRGREVMARAVHLSCFFAFPMHRQPPERCWGDRGAGLGAGEGLGGVGGRVLQQDESGVGGGVASVLLLHCVPPEAATGGSRKGCV